MSPGTTGPQTLIDRVAEVRRSVGDRIHDEITEALYAQADGIAANVVTVSARRGFDWDDALDRLLTSRWLGFPAMLALLAGVFWITIALANVPSAMIADALFWLEARLALAFQGVGAPWWLEGFLVHGVYRGLAWVVAVMLPPMAIFFPIFTLLEDLGYLPRVAFNLDQLFRWAGAHGKQALTMGMGFGCNAAGVIACRVIDSPRERMIAIVTNNFVPCNGRWPTLIMLATVFVASAFPPALGSLVAVGAVVAVTLLGIFMTLLVSKALSLTMLRGVASSFQLELPSFRRPQILRVLYTSLIDRTMIVLWRAVIMAAPAGGLIWVLANVPAPGGNVFGYLTALVDPAAQWFGLDGVILLAYIVAIPANEIIVPTIIMGYSILGNATLAAGEAGFQMTDITEMAQLKVLFEAHGFTLLTAICFMLFSLLHYPCSTVSMTIYRETGSLKWTVLANVIPLGVALVVCFTVATVARALWGL